MRFSIPGAAYFFLSPPPFKYFFPKILLKSTE